ncbi:hypothetical protein MKW98_012178, partial [Papaver atlanticum]
MAEPASPYTGPKDRYIYLPNRKVRVTLDCIYLGKLRKERLRKEYQEKVEAIKAWEISIQYGWIHFTQNPCTTLVREAEDAASNKT